MLETYISTRPNFSLLKIKEKSYILSLLVYSEINIIRLSQGHHFALCSKSPVEPMRTTGSAVDSRFP